MRAALDAIQTKAGAIDPGLSKVLGRVFEWLPELFDRAAFEVALEEFGPHYDAWTSVEKPESQKVIRQVLERREVLYKGVDDIVRRLAYMYMTGGDNA